MPVDVKFLSASQFLLTTLVVKVAVVAVLATMLVRFQQFRRILLTEQRAWRERLVFAAAFGLPLCGGVTARLLLNYNASDLSLAGPFLTGLIAGPYAGAIVGVLVGAPALIAGELIALPFAVGCGFSGGGLREICPKEAIWRFSPMFFADLHRHAGQLVSRLRVDWLVALLAAPVGLELLRLGLGLRFDDHLFNMQPPNAWLALVVVVSTVMCVTIPIKIWNTARIEHRLQEQEKLLLAARLEALSNQINPHFLFNTLTSISSLIRSQPDTARTLILKLSRMLRRLLRSGEQFVTLREELASIDEYLDIETARFGPTLAVEKEISEDSLGLIMPSMLLQPLVENSIKHGLTRKVGGGRVTIRSRRTGDHAIIEVADNGAGMAAGASGDSRNGGIGLRNVDERLRVIYGENYHLRFESTPGEGTCARIRIPVVDVPRPAAMQAVAE